VSTRDGRRGGNGHGGTSPLDSPPEWPLWEQRIGDPDGRLWKVRTMDVLEAPGQIHPRLAKTLAETKGRFRTTVISPRGALIKDVYIPDRDQAIAYHRRMVHQAHEGLLPDQDQ
jgi:hypothetical protein